mgnify:CR=1 FL=1
MERIQLKHTLLLTLVYGPDGESPVDDSDLTEHLDSQMYELAYVNIPLYNTSTFVFASDDQKAQMLQLAQAAAASCSETQDGSVSEQVSALHSAASAALPDIYAVLDSTPAEDASSVQTELLTESDLTGAFTQDGAADAVRGLVYGEAAAVQYNAASIILMMRIDPLQVSTLDALRTQILSDMKGDELEDALTAYGSTLENDLSTSAMNKMPASKIVNPSSSQQQPDLPPNAQRPRFHTRKRGLFRRCILGRSLRAALPLILQDVPHVLQGVHGAVQLFVPQLGAQAGIAALHEIALLGHQLHSLAGKLHIGAARFTVGLPCHKALVLQLFNGLGKLCHLQAHNGSKVSQINLTVRVLFGLHLDVV